MHINCLVGNDDLGFQLRVIGNNPHAPRSLRPDVYDSLAPDIGEWMVLHPIMWALVAARLRASSRTWKIRLIALSVLIPVHARPSTEQVALSRFVVGCVPAMGWDGSSCDPYFKLVIFGFSGANKLR